MSDDTPDELHDRDLADDNVFERFDLPFKTPVEPQRLTSESKIRFCCHKDVECFNACCKSIDFTLTPYDILRLSRRLEMKTWQFLLEYGIPYEMDAHGMPGVKMRPVDGGTACRFMTDEGCSVYEDRPTACRYYPLGMMGMRRKGGSTLEDLFFVVKEEHCLGHNEPRELTVGEYRAEQGVEPYDDMNRDWMDIIVKKKSAGPTVGAPSERSMQLFGMSYDLDSFREFFQSDGFQGMFDLDEENRSGIASDDTALLRFAMRFLKQVLFGEQRIPMKPGAAKKRYEERKDVIVRKHWENVEKYREKDPREGATDD